MERDLFEYYSTPRGYTGETVEEWTAAQPSGGQGPSNRFRRGQQRVPGFGAITQYLNHIQAEENAGRSIDPKNPFLINHYGAGYKESDRRSEPEGGGFRKSAFMGREDSSPTFLGNPVSEGNFSGSQNFLGTNYPGSNGPPMGSPPPYIPSPYSPSPYSPPPGQYYGNNIPGSLDSYGSSGGEYLDGGLGSQSVPPSMQGIMSLAQSVVANSAQGMADGGRVRTKMGADGFRKGGPMQRMVSEMSNYASGRR